MQKFKFYFSTFIFLVLYIFWPVPVSAHGGFMKEAGPIKVYVKQIPVSPLVGETVKFNVSFRDTSLPQNGNLNRQDMAYKPVSVTVTDTAYGDESKDKIIFKSSMLTDSASTIEFKRIFNKENYFDIDFQIKDSKGDVQSTGFLVLPRDSKNPNPDISKEYREVVTNSEKPNSSLGMLNKLLEFISAIILKLNK